MDIYSSIGFEEILESDVQVLSEIMRRAFDEDAERHLGEKHGGPPGYDNGDFIRKWYFHEDVRAFKILNDATVIGGVAVFVYESGENFLGNVFIDPEWQDKGIGMTVWRFIEQKFPETKIWKTETPGYSKRNHHFYVNKCGFKIVRLENPKDKHGEVYKMEKYMQLHDATDTGMSAIGFSSYVRSRLVANGIKTVEALLAYNNPNGLKGLRGVGVQTQAEIIAGMRKSGYCDWADRMEAEDASRNTLLAEAAKSNNMVLSASKPYKDNFSKRSYTIMIEREQNGKSFQEIAELLHISVASARAEYKNTKRRQVKLYSDVIKKSCGDDPDLQPNYHDLHARYGDYIYIAAYLEQAYRKILAAYREGEPESHYIIPKLLDENVRQPIVGYIGRYDAAENYIETHIIVPNEGGIGDVAFRMVLSKYEAMVVQLKNVEKVSPNEIANRLELTESIIRDLYDDACRVWYNRMLAILSARTGKSFSVLRAERREFSNIIFSRKKDKEFFRAFYCDILKDELKNVNCLAALI